MHTKVWQRGQYIPQPKDLATKFQQIKEMRNENHTVEVSNSPHFPAALPDTHRPPADCS